MRLRQVGVWIYRVTFCAAVGVLAVGLVLAIILDPNVALFLFLIATTACLVGYYAGHRDARAAPTEKPARPLGGALRGEEWAGVYYCQACEAGRAWWHCCRHEVNLCYRCLILHDAADECVYIPAHRAVFPAKQQLVRERLSGRREDA